MMGNFYSPLHSMWAAGGGMTTTTSTTPETTSFTAAPSAVTPTSSCASAPSPPTSRGYEGPTTTSSSASPDHYGYPPTPPKEVKLEDALYPGSSALSIAEMYNHPTSTIKRPEGSESYTSSAACSTSITSPTSYQSSNHSLAVAGATDLGSPLYGSYSTTGIFEKSLQKSVTASSGKHKCNSASSTGKQKKQLVFQMHFGSFCNKW